VIAGVVLGAVAGLDRTAFGQTLLAHPFVAANVSGWIAGSPDTGLRAGVLFWMLSAGRVPVGETRIRDWTTAAVVLPWCVPDTAPDAARGLVFLSTLVVALVGGAAIRGIRDVARRSIEGWRSRPVIGRGDPAALHLGLTSLHALRGAMLTALAIVIGRGLVALDLTTPGTFLGEIMGVTWALAPWALLPLLWRAHGDLGRSRAPWGWMVGGAVSALVLGLVLRGGA